MAEGEAPGDYINQRQDLHDCFFLVGREKKERISTVKFFLVNYSSYFRAMLLETDMRERHSKQDIEIPDHEPDVFKLMLSYVYGSQNLKFKDIDQAMRFHLLVDKCLMSKLKKLSSDYLTENCTTDLCAVLECHVLLQIKEMESRATEMVMYNTNSLISSKDFVDLNTDIIVFIVKQDILSVSEVELWKGVLKWAKHQSGASSIRYTLREVLEHMRFLTMTPKEFAEQVVVTSVLTPEEVISVFVGMATGTSCGLHSLCSKKRNDTPFSLALDVDLVPLNQYTELDARSCIIQVKSIPLQLISIQLERNSAEHIYVTLLQGGNTIFNLDLYSSVSDYKLETAVLELQPNQSYELRVQYNQNFLRQQPIRSSLMSRQRTSGQSYSQTRADIFGDCKFCTIKRNSHRNGYNSYQFTSCFKSLQFKQYPWSNWTPPNIGHYNDESSDES